MTLDGAQARARRDLVVGMRVVAPSTATVGAAVESSAGSRSPPRPPTDTLRAGAGDRSLPPPGHRPLSMERPPVRPDSYQYFSTWSVPAPSLPSRVKPRASAQSITDSIMPGLPHSRMSKLSGVRASPVSFSIAPEAITSWT